MMHKNPAVILVVSVGAALTGAFVLVMQIGINSRENGKIRYNYDFKGAPSVASTYIKDFEQGVKVVKAKSAAAYSGFFGGDAPAAQTQQQVASASDSGDGEGVTYKRPAGYPEGYDEEEFPYEMPPDQVGGGGSVYGGGSASSGEAPQENAAAVPVEKGASGKEKPAATEKPGTPREVFKGRPGEERKSALERGYAALEKSGGLGQARGNAPGGSVSDGAAGGALKSPGSKGLPSWAKNTVAGGLPGGGLDGLRSSADSSYNSKMKAGAATAGASGPGAPKASGPAAASGSDSSSGSSSGSSSTGSSSDKTVSPKSTGEEDEEEDGDSGSGSGSGYNDYSAPSEDLSLLGTVISEKRNGGEFKYISSEDALGDPEEGLLKSGGMPVYDEKAAFEKDPAKLADLSAERKKELKKEIHAFLKKVENKYGTMTDIFATSCSLTPGVCKEHELEGKYLTMTTVKGARLVMGLKYIDDRWQPYTVEFKDSYKSK
ncbi:MAG TPA: hypothetical protein DCZ92_05255 [Elusimicrobia bacterium]|nr:MAG: hypothetical protein A2016_10390 [Elusimicrobia bacterium GWF2_62_30]HBA60213.1 hypothetical protein [Elusimicrobiota bacterium]